LYKNNTCGQPFNPKNREKGWPKVLFLRQINAARIKHPIEKINKLNNGRYYSLYLFLFFVLLYKIILADNLLTQKIGKKVGRKYYFYDKLTPQGMRRFTTTFEYQFRRWSLCSSHHPRQQIV
jgi:hypothetical protein